jgi:hypothetical protein
LWRINETAVWAKVNTMNRKPVQIPSSTRSEQSGRTDCAAFKLTLYSRADVDFADHHLRSTRIMRLVPAQWGYGLSFIKGVV